MTCHVHTWKLIQINFGMGFVMRHIDTNECRYYVAGENDTFFPQAIFVSRPDDMMHTLHDNANPQDMWERVFSTRSSTKWIVEFMTNITIFIYHVNYAMGCGAEVPEYVKSCHSLITLDKSYSSGKLYNDNLCAVRCLAVHRNLKADKSFHYKLESQTKQFSKEFPLWCDGISLVDIPRFENEFSVDVDIYSLSPDHSVIPRYMSKSKHGDKMVLKRHTFVLRQERGHSLD